MWGQSVCAVQANTRIFGKERSNREHPRSSPIPERHGLLVLSRTPLSEDIENRLEDEGWNLLYARDADEVRSLTGKTAIRLGLIVLSKPHDTAWFGECRNIAFDMGSVTWVAAIDQGQVDRHEVKRFISLRLRGFQYFPPDATRLSYMLADASSMAAVEESLRMRETLDESGRYGLVGRSPAMRDLYDRIQRAAATDETVLIFGATGTGKERVAKAIHEHSARAAGPFIITNCASIPHSLLQSELFGHEKGAFTNAFERKLGYAESAAGGTLVLDEIGEMPLESQASLLRFLEEKRIVRVGGTRAYPVDIRIIASTNNELREKIAKKTFREDLFYRLSVLTVRTPKLSERVEDIEALAHHFLARATQGFGSTIRGFSEDALAALTRYEWPGNVRELASCIARTAVADVGPRITAKDLDLAKPPFGQSFFGLKNALENTEKRALEFALRRSRWNVSNAARDLEISRMTLYRLMDKHGISREEAPAS